MPLSYDLDLQNCIFKVDNTHARHVSPGAGNPEHYWQHTTAFFEPTPARRQVSLIFNSNGFTDIFWLIVDLATSS
eukprot:SAG11_NODE_4941_length_1716_cov_1.466296_1_plen_75_part_00